MKPLSQLQNEILCKLRDDLTDAEQGSKDALKSRAMALLGWSLNKLHFNLKRPEIGYETARKPRSDKGRTSAPQAELELLAGVVRASQNKKGQRMPFETAIGLLEANGLLTKRLSAASYGRLMKAQGLHPCQLDAPAPSVRLTSLYPNHVAQVDSTTGALYYDPSSRATFFVEESEVNKNKLGNAIKVIDKLLTRFMWVDHTSGAWKVRFFAGGETTQNLIEFVVWCICKQPLNPMHGVPKIIMADQGPANKSHLMKAFCKHLGIELILHKPGNARATGSVEKSHDLVRMHLETRWKFQDPRAITLDSINNEAQAWSAAYCSTRVHTRTGRTRFGGWMEINKYPGALRVPASDEVLREAATSTPVTPKVDSSRRISFKGRPYNLALVPGVIPGQKVTVRVNVFRAPAIDVRAVDVETQDEVWHVVEPEELNEWGFDGRNVIGNGFKGVPNSVVDDNRAQLLREAYRTGDGLPSLEDAEKARKSRAPAYAGVVDSMADVNATEVPAYLPRKVTPLVLPERRVEARRITVVEACMVMLRRLGSRYKPQFSAYMRAEFPDGVPEDQINTIVERMLALADDGEASARKAGSQ